MLQVRRLRVLQEVAARGSFSAAAEELMLTQSAVSQHIAALEGEVGLSLVERGTRPVQLTAAGFSLTRHAAGILNRLDAAEQEMAELVDRRQARLRFGCFPTVLGTLMPAAFAQFRRSHPDVRLTIVDDHLHRLLPRLQSGELDVAVIYDHDALPDVAALDLERTPLLEDKFQAVLPAGHLLARRRTLRLKDLADEAWIGGAPASAWYRIVRHACRQAGFTPHAGFASDDYVAVQALVAAGLGVSVIPGLAVMHPLPGIVVRPLSTDAPTRLISAACPVDGYRGPALSAMLRTLQTAAKGLT
jgi:DNA-binding transcriptional LysR family regulator